MCTFNDKLEKCFQLQWRPSFSKLFFLRLFVDIRVNNNVNNKCSFKIEYKNRMIGSVVFGFGPSCPHVLLSRCGSSSKATMFPFIWPDAPPYLLERLLTSSPVISLFVSRVFSSSCGRSQAGCRPDLGELEPVSAYWSELGRWRTESRRPPTQVDLLVWTSSPEPSELSDGLKHQQVCRCSFFKLDDGSQNIWTESNIWIVNLWSKSSIISRLLVWFK